MTNEKAPERVWIWTSEPYQWHDTKTDDSDVEYARVDRKYFCSCGAALTAEEYITHLFELGHDRGNPAFTASAAPVVDASEVVRQIRDKMVNGNPATLLADIAELVAPKRHEGESKCEHGIPWSMECLTCGPPDYVAAATTAAPQAADNLLRNAGAIIIVNEGDAGARVEIRFAELQDAQRLHKTLVQRRAAVPVEQEVYVSEHPVTLRCNTCGLVQVKSFKCPRGDGQLVAGAASVEQSESQ